MPDAITECHVWAEPPPPPPLNFPRGLDFDWTATVAIKVECFHSLVKLRGGTR